MQGVRAILLLFVLEIVWTIKPMVQRSVSK